MVPAGRTEPSLWVLVGVVGMVALLGPVAIVLVVGWVASLTVALAAGLAVSLLLTMLLLAGGWWLVRQIQREDRALAPEDFTPPAPLSGAERGEQTEHVSPKPETRTLAPVHRPLVEDDPISQRIVARLPVLDPAGLPTSNGRLSESYREIVQLYRREAARSLDALHEAAAVPDVTLVARIAHTLAGSSSSIGALRMAAACSALELLAKGAAEKGAAAQAPSAPPISPGGPSGPASRDHPLDDRGLPEAVEEVRRELRQLEAALAHLTAEGPAV